MNKEKLDLILVPIGLFIMILYHFTLLYRYRKHPENTINGFENKCKRQWVETMMALELKDRSLAITVCNTHVLAATSLSSISLVLSSLIGAWLGSSNENIYTSSLIYGDTGPSIMSVKYIAILSCFLIAFGCFVQTARCFVHAIFLITMPSFKTHVPGEMDNVKHEVVLGSNFWSLGVRAMYFAATLLMWVFGPIPMIVSSVIMVVVLFLLDTNWSLVPFVPPTDGTTEIPLEKTELEMSDVKMNFEGQATVDIASDQGVTYSGQLQSFSLSFSAAKQKSS